MFIKFGDDPLDSVQVARTGAMVDLYLVADAERGKRGGGADGVQQVLTGVDRVGERAEMLIQLAGHDGIQQ
jgi:hypothetical protein